MRVHEFTITSDFGPQELKNISHQAAQFSSDVLLEFERNGLSNTMDAKSMLGMMLLPIRAGTKVRLITKGKDEEVALDFIWRLLERKG